MNGGAAEVMFVELEEAEEADHLKDDEDDKC